ncbi:predicted protein [Sclerotinia sclerotiorum 1980 UF-70]|uniref:Uncharacterized protein n=1 Tax=Sclerotinia sclerotiorum (strain ATCC 18683 / 1980 / Ss-1) TaxID=665079 RepID=A7F760_SCLS1|nr:predicted protein [Sclerotinia sclerotiorum 1980 UF-70]EDN98581.1 predicted protein [Sclerotinia sclerotiorum 1980 UF-70]
MSKTSIKSKSSPHAHPLPPSPRNLIPVRQDPLFKGFEMFQPFQNIDIDRQTLKDPRISKRPAAPVNPVIPRFPLSIDLFRVPKRNN